MLQVLCNESLASTENGEDQRSTYIVHCHQIAWTSQGLHHSESSSSSGINSIDISSLHHSESSSSSGISESSSSFDTFIDLSPSLVDSSIDLSHPFDSDLMNQNVVAVKNNHGQRSNLNVGLLQI
ncbi:hypothetical protein K1719_009147 [Acacia pycnantha]|nr:hypothetical protein K1719_009147 [Acacia pycnantha]